MSRQGGTLSVFKHEYRAYEGRITPPWARIGVLVRYGLAEAWSSKVTVGLLTMSMLPLVVYLVIIYLANNPLARALIMRGNSSMLAINASFFLRVLASQCYAGDRIRTVLVTGATGGMGRVIAALAGSPRVLLPARAVSSPGCLVCPADRA